MVRLMIATAAISVAISEPARAVDLQVPFDYSDAIRSAKVHRGTTENAVLGMCMMNWKYAAETRERVFKALRDKNYLSQPGVVFAEMGDSSCLRPGI